MAGEKPAQPAHGSEATTREDALEEAVRGLLEVIGYPDGIERSVRVNAANAALALPRTPTEGDAEAARLLERYADPAFNRGKLHEDMLAYLRARATPKET